MKARLKASAKRFLKVGKALGKSGQTTAEYVLILAIVVMLVMKFRETFTKSMGSATNKVGDKIDQVIEDIDNYQ